MPQAWEISQQGANSVLIAIIAPPGGVSIDWALSFAAMEKPDPWDVIRVSGLPFGEARTQAAYHLLSTPHQFLFFIDCDILAPKDTIPRLLSHRLPIVSALYHQRFPTWTGLIAEYLPCMFNEGKDPAGNSVKVPITQYVPGALIDCAYVPGGALLIHRSVFERMIQAGIKKLFEWTLNVENPQGRSEDFDWCGKVRSLGYKCVCDTSLVCAHEAGAKVDQKGLQPRL